ncbi:putative permease of the major facilitator superfamily,AmpG-like protein [Magnetofaba australis IT-1]|uniref:Putative permease of the major facilitator superfamily,AmpG-like protein n=1 Tax=Magnetofaba australis IT-1 TaxID=1434232 RepID=A0A1Y2K4B0_9PROT|nr:putative permease of the major facilitator superfamily,AmpG-like protein [Magnetofaba australis IT-1]
MIAILFLGFSSGLPLALTFGTLTLWLAEAGVSKTAIGLFALAGTPYTMKFLWAPLVDRLRIPLFCRLLGRRRGWALFSQLALMVSILALGSTHPAENAQLTALFTLCVAFWSATQDIVIDAYRVELLEERQQGAGAAMVVLGYRIGMLASGAGALYIASASGWFMAYAIMAGLVSVGMLTVLLNPEPATESTPESLKQDERCRALLEKRAHWGPRSRAVITWLYAAVWSPFVEFLTRKGAIPILLFILLYKFGDALAGVMNNPFYVELGFTKIEIANISKAFGLAATIVGGVLGGVVVNRLGIMRALLVCGVLQMVSNLMFVILAWTGRDLTALTAAIAVENLAGGLGTAAFVAYLSSLCNVAYTATQYALLSSFMAIGRQVLSSGGGWVADQMSWAAFFSLTTLAALPGLLLLLWMMQRYPLRRDAVN